LGMLETILGAGLLFLLDWRSKQAVSGLAANGGLAVGPMLRIRRVAHTSALYRSRKFRSFLAATWLVALVSAILLHRLGARFQSPVALWGLGAAFGGAAGNLRDIFRWHYVVDFIDLGWWPVFNLADVAIVAGLAAAFLG
jgi:signal peptidase II